jgi:hypothetical protein
LPKGELKNTSTLWFYDYIQCPFWFAYLDFDYKRSREKTVSLE